MATLPNAESDLLEKMEVFNCLTTFQSTQLTQLKQWSLLHANQPIVPQATPVPGFERLILPPQNVDQDIIVSTKQAPESMQEKSFFDDFSDVNDIFNGPTESSEFNFNPEKDIDQVPDRTDFDVFLDEVLGIQDLYGSNITPLPKNGELTTQVCYDLVQSQPNSLLYGQPSGCFDSQSNSPINSNGPFHSPSLHYPTTAPLQNEPSDPLQSQPDEPPNSLFHNQPNSPYQSQTNSSPHSQPNSPMDSHINSPSHVPIHSLFQNQSSSPCNSQANSPLHSQPSSPLDSHLSNPSHSPSHSPVSLLAIETSSNIYSADEGIGSQSDMSECDDDVLELSMSPSVSSPLPDSTNQQLSSLVKQDPELLSAKPGRRKRGPRPQVKYRGDGPMQLWQFLLELLIAPEYSKLVKWTLDEDYEFKILKPSQVARMWGDKKNKPTMNYEKLSRGLRYYYGKSVIEKVHGKRYVYQFKCNIPKILGYDPMVAIKREESVEDSVCGEPIMSPEVEDLLVTPSAEGGLLAFL